MRSFSDTAVVGTLIVFVFFAVVAGSAGFLTSGVRSALVGILVIFTADTADINVGTGKEFQAAVAAVIGGALITGSYGSPIGALLFGMVNRASSARRSTTTGSPRSSASPAVS